MDQKVQSNKIFIKNINFAYYFLCPRAENPQKGGNEHLQTSVQLCIASSGCSAHPISPTRPWHEIVAGLRSLVGTLCTIIVCSKHQNQPKCTPRAHFRPRKSSQDPAPLQRRPQTPHHTLARDRSGFAPFGCLFISDYSVP